MKKNSGIFSIKNDFKQPYLKVARLLFAMASLMFAVYMLPGLWSASLKAISAFVLPMGTQDFTSSDAAYISVRHTDETEPMHLVTYYEQMKMYESEL